MKFVSKKHNQNFDPENPADCSECWKEDAKLIRFGDKPSIGSHTTFLCESCLNDAIKLLNDYTA